jgi:cupin-like protein
MREARVVSTALAERTYPRDSDQLPSSALQVLDADPVTFRQCFGRLPVVFRHNLASRGLFTIDRLTEIAERMIAMGQTGRINMHQAAQTATGGIINERQKKPVASALSQLENSSWRINLVGINEFDSELDDVYRKTLEDVETLLGTRIVKDAKFAHMNVFVASPHMITPYHFDHGHNFLFQIANEKSAWLWDPEDRETLPYPEIEDFYLLAWDRPRRELDLGRAREFRLRPGDVLHHPSLAPHWVKNGPSVSISVAIQFSTAALERRARIYQVNGVLRRAGLTPPPPSINRVLDGLRSGIMRVLAKRSPKNQGEVVWSGIMRLKKWRKRLPNYRT